MGEPAKPTANPVVVLREEFDDWAVLYNPDTAAAVGANPVGVAIWKHLDGTHTLTDIAEDISDRFTDVPDNILEHVRDFVGDLEAKGFTVEPLDGADQ